MDASAARLVVKLATLAGQRRESSSGRPQNSQHPAPEDNPGQAPSPSGSDHGNLTLLQLTTEPNTGSGTQVGMGAPLREPLYVGSSSEAVELSVSGKKARGSSMPTAPGTASCTGGWALERQAGTGCWTGRTQP